MRLSPQGGVIGVRVRRDLRFLLQGDLALDVFLQLRTFEQLVAGGGGHPPVAAAPAWRAAAACPRLASLAASPPPRLGGPLCREARLPAEARYTAAERRARPMAALGAIGRQCALAVVASSSSS